jgi:hypothetical protein
MRAILEAFPCRPTKRFEVKLSRNGRLYPRSNRLALNPASSTPVQRGNIDSIGLACRNLPGTPLVYACRRQLGVSMLSRVPRISARIVRRWPAPTLTVGHLSVGHLFDAAVEAMLNKLATERGACAEAQLRRVRRPDMDFECRRASRVTRGPVPWRQPHAVSEPRVFVCRAAGTWTP